MFLKAFKRVFLTFSDFILAHVPNMPQLQYVPSITLTYTCNNDCHYCFTRLLEKHFPPYMSVENFSKAIKWLKKTKIRKIALWGGEPTNHPEIHLILDICKRENMKVFLYTNNFFDDLVLKKITNDYVKEVDIDYSLSFSNNPNYAQYLKNLDSLYKKRVKFTFCCRIPEKGDYNDLIRKLKKYHTYVKYASMIIPQFPDSEVSIKQLRKWARDTIKILKLMQRNNVKFILRRPVPRCLFSDREWRYLKNYHKARSRCYLGEYNPYENHYMRHSSLLTINPDLSIFPCNGVFLKGPSILSFKNIKEVDNFLKNFFWKKWRWSILLMEKCKNCKYFINKECQGGCLSYKYHKVYKNQIGNLIENRQVVLTFNTVR